MSGSGGGQVGELRLGQGQAQAAVDPPTAVGVDVCCVIGSVGVGGFHLLYMYA